MPISQKSRKSRKSHMSRIAITLGDPAGVGPEVVAKWLTVRTAGGEADPNEQILLIGTSTTLTSGLDVAAKAGFDVAGLREIPRITSMSEAAGRSLCLLDTGVQMPATFEFGAVNPACGTAAVRSVEIAAQACLAGDMDAMVTAPINKASVHASGCADIGHQEMLARLANVDWTATMLMTPGLRVAHLSTHKSLAQAVAYVTRDTVFSKLQLVHATLTHWGLPAPRIAVAALNPHGGEEGLLGREEIDELAPAVADAVGEGIDVTGPIPADSVFNRAINGEFDVVLALYHDQGHIAIKVQDFHNSVTATLGIPFIRTSVDHGTAFDIAGQGIADPSGMAAAVSAARALAVGRLAEFQGLGHS